MSFARNINNEMKKYDVRYLNPKKMTPQIRNMLFWNKFKKMKFPFVRCETCGKRIHNDNNLIQKHFMEHHAVNTQTEKLEKGFRIIPSYLNPRSII